MVQLFIETRLAGRDRGDLAEFLHVNGLQNRTAEGRLVFEVRVHRALRVAGVVGDIVETRCRVTVLQEPHTRGGEDARSGGRLLLGAGGSRHEVNGSPRRH